LGRGLYPLPSFSLEETMINFDHLTEQNFKRCTEDFKHPLESWSIAEWTNAMAGECGEACNITKKLLRFRSGHGHMNDKSEGTLRKALGEELADVVLYADLIASSMGLCLGELVVDKFNKDSLKHGAKTTL
jgi:NTP pyrophosphatase (non-canonical NTP hydrolase)